MDNTYCHNGYCEPEAKESNNVEINGNVEISDKIMIGGYFLFMIALTAVVLYGASIGIYVDPASLV